jgi:hypothetical protein
LYLYTGGVPYSLNQFVTNTNTNINTLTTKLTNISYASNKTTISGNTEVADIDFTGSINNFSKTDFNNAINRCKSLTDDCQKQLDDLETALIAVGIIETTTTGLVFTGFFSNH